MQYENDPPRKHRISSEDLAAIIVDALLDAGCIEKKICRAQLRSRQRKSIVGKRLVTIERRLAIKLGD